MGALGVTVGIEDRAHGKARAGAPTIFGGRMQVGQRLDIGERGAHDFAHNSLLGARPLKYLRRGIEP
jgi:hypothetical protein